MASRFTSKVRTSYGAEVADTPQTGIPSPYGNMLPGPEYEKFKAAQQQYDALVKLVEDIAGLRISREAALQALSADYSLVASTDIRMGIEATRAVIEGQTGQIPGRGLTLIAGALHEAHYHVGGWASHVPKPPRPDAVQPTPGQPLGSGAYEREYGVRR